MSDLPNKYNLSTVVDNLEVNAKQLVNNALQNAEKTITPGTILAHWKEIIIILLVGVFVYGYHSIITLKADLNAAKSQAIQSDKVVAIDNTLKAVTDHQQDYAKLDTAIAAMDDTRKQLKDINSKIQQLDIKKYQAATAKLTKSEVAKQLEALGYPSK